LVVSCRPDRIAAVQILSIEDNITGEAIKFVDVYVQPDDAGPGKDGDIFMDVLAPIVIPISVGKCSYILIEPEGYKDWEEAFCPTEVLNMPVNITLSPIGESLPVKDEEVGFVKPIAYWVGFILNIAQSGVGGNHSKDFLIPLSKIALHAYTTG